MAAPIPLFPAKAGTQAALPMCAAPGPVRARRWRSLFDHQDTKTTKTSGTLGLLAVLVVLVVEITALRAWSFA